MYQKIRPSTHIHASQRVKRLLSTVESSYLEITDTALLIKLQLCHQCCRLFYSYIESRAIVSHTVQVNPLCVNDRCEESKECSLYS